MSREKARLRPPPDTHQPNRRQALERVGAEDYRLPWHRSGRSSVQPKNAHTKNPYRGINIVSLWVAAEVRQYRHALWASFKQWAGTWRTRAQGRALIDGRLLQTVRRGTQPRRRRRRRQAPRRSRYSNVFNVAQVDGFSLPDTPATSIVERDQAADAFFAATKADIRHGGEMAFWRPWEDNIQMPDERLFRGSAYGSPKEDLYHRTRT